MADLRQQAETIGNQQQFLAAYREMGNISGAAKAAGVGRRTVYEWIDGDAEFKAAFKDAHEEAADALEGEARRRAKDGVREPMLYKGRVVAAKKTYSDTLLIFLLKGLRPETYRERHEHRHTGKDGGAIQVQHSAVNLRYATDDELTWIEAFHARLAQRALEAAAAEAPPPPLPEPHS